MQTPRCINWFHRWSASASKAAFVSFSKETLEGSQPSSWSHSEECTNEIKINQKINQVNTESSYSVQIGVANNSSSERRQSTTAVHHCIECVCVTYSFVHIVYYWLLLYDNKIYLKERIRNDASVPCISHLSNHPVAYPSTQSPQIELI
jgi:hypothetical protein